jgi:hypothetical protein
MVCVRVPLLLKRKFGVLFSVLRGPRSDASPPFFSLLCFCIVVRKMERTRHHNDTEP